MPPISKRDPEASEEEETEEEEEEDENVDPRTTLETPGKYII